MAACTEMACRKLQCTVLIIIILAMIDIIINLLHSMEHICRLTVSRPCIVFIALFCVAPCVVDGKSYPSGTNFTAPDGCNTW